MPQGNPQGYVTPPFVMPDPSIAGQGDPYAELTQLLQQLQNQVYTPPQESTLTKVLTALAEGASIGASRDPGAALSNVLQNRQQKVQQTEQIRQQQRNTIMMAQIQAATEKARAMTQEGAQARGQAREAFYNEQASKSASNRRIQETKEIDLNKLDLQAKEFEQNQLLLSKFEPDINRRKRFDAGLQAIPQQMQESLKAQTLMQTLVPDMPEAVAKSIADKQVGLAPRTFSSVENQWFSKFSQLRSEEYKQDKDLARRVKESEITENEAQSLYYSNSKIQDRYANALQTNLGNAVADAVDTNYYRIFVGTPDERIVSQKQLSALMQDRIMSITAKPQPLSAEENTMQQQKQVKALSEYRTQVQQPMPTSMPGQPTVTSTDPILNKIKQFAQSHNREETLNEILSSPMAIELKQKYVRLVTEQFESLKGQMTPATSNKKETKNALPAGVNIKDFMKR